MVGLTRSPLGEGTVSHLSASMADAGCLREYNRALRGMRREGACRDFTSPAARTSQPQRDVPKARKWPAANAKTFARYATLHGEGSNQFLSLRHQSVA